MWLPCGRRNLEYAKAYRRRKKVEMLFAPGFSASSDPETSLALRGLPGGTEGIRTTDLRSGGARGGAPPLPRLNIAQGALLDPVLDRCCFPCPTRGQYVESLAGLDQDCDLPFHNPGRSYRPSRRSPPITRCL